MITWLTSSRCNGSGCVELTQVDGKIWVRDSKDPNSFILVFDRQEWADFITAVKSGEWDFDVFTPNVKGVDTAPAT